MKIMKRLYFTICLMLASAFCFSQSNPRDCLVAWYPFTGNAVDSSGHNHNGSVNGAVLTTDRFGTLNAAYSFNGSSSYIGISNYADITGYSEFSISAWIYPTTVSVQQCIISKVTPNRDFALKLESTDQLRTEFSLSSNYNYCYAAGTIPVNTWTHVASVWKDTTWYVYINGVLSSQCHNATAPSSPAWSGTEMAIGKLASTNYFTGKLDDVRLYDCALSAPEVLQLYSSVGEGQQPKILINIFPNPSNNNFTIETPEKATIEILNIAGQIIKTINTADKHTSIDVSDLSGGIYIIKAKTEGGVAIKKFIKEENQK